MIDNHDCYITQRLISHIIEIISHFDKDRYDLENLDKLSIELKRQEFLAIRDMPQHSIPYDCLPDINFHIIDFVRLPHHLKPNYELCDMCLSIVEPNKAFDISEYWALRPKFIVAKEWICENCVSRLGLIPLKHFKGEKTNERKSITPA